MYSVLQLSYHSMTFIDKVLDTERFLTPSMKKEGRKKVTKDESDQHLASTVFAFLLSYSQKEKGST